VLEMQVKTMCALTVALAAVQRSGDTAEMER
jgi:hypothetical protein